MTTRELSAGAAPSTVLRRAMKIQIPLLVVSAAAAGGLLLQVPPLLERQTQLRGEIGALEAKKGDLEEELEKTLSEVESGHAELKQLELEAQEREKAMEATRAKIEHARERGTISAGAAEELEKGLQEPDAAKARAAWQQGEEDARGGREQAAKDQYNAALAHDPDFAPAYHSLGRIEHNNERFEKAKEYYERALKLDPQYAPSLTNMAQLEMQLGHRDAAIEYARKALKVEPGYRTPKRVLSKLNAAL